MKFPTLLIIFQDLHLLLLKYREEIIQAKVAKEHTESSLKSENMFLKSQVHAEQEEKNTLEETLNQEINSLQEKLGNFDRHWPLLNHLSYHVHLV